ncbi:hypothetical protein CLV28_2501 [Sediminihabitans luteus]|uniref:Uncharacterized protein n=1 Tax=Sediminihabitans luteus TaxID=1138585 RepID=A0A2M9CDL2_9CELL|nr:Rv3235 family protein [Sediminihabitans luteus]PJJ70024.1 hypothetical protein CLV28_2501 [Sediminihabitans luteus]GII99345.1 hypothetical protein Slu03_17230 [Sediminihabitans luteus]
MSATITASPALNRGSAAPTLSVEQSSPAITAVAVPRPARRSTRPAGTPLGAPPVLDVSHVRRPGPHRASARPLPSGAATSTRLPDPTGVACAVARTALEVLRGERPVAQLVRWVSPDVYEVLGRRARLLRDAPGSRTARDRVVVRRSRTVRLGDDAAEVTVVLVDGPRLRAAAARVEVHRGTWRVVALEIG